MIDWDNWYSAKEAINALSKNSNKRIMSGHLSFLAKKGIVETILLRKNKRLYKKEQIDNYIVEDRGVKMRRRREIYKLLTLKKCGISFLRKTSYK